MASMSRGPRNDLTDVGGIAVGHHQRIGRGWLTGTTVVIPPRGAVGGVDVRGGGPGTRETDTLNPINLVSNVDAICLSGGSAYGLDAATGAMGFLAERNRGFTVGPEPHHVVPIVPGAVLFDLGRGGRFEHRPDASFGYRAASRARPRPIAQGNVGAGTGAFAGRLKGGIGSASVVTPAGITVAALVALNSAGSPVDLGTGLLWGAAHGVGDEFAHLRRPSAAERKAFAALHEMPRALNTTLAIVATDASLSKAECTRMAGAGHDGMARALKPIHTYTDGDVVFALATGAHCDAPSDGEPCADADVSPSQLAAARLMELAVIFTAAADAVARAIVHATLAAATVGDHLSYLDQFPSAARRGL
ncbi:MAG: P1 family peptidase [Acidimicrobiia bacterium]